MWLPGSAHLAQQLESALSRQAKVEHDQIERTARDNRLGRLGTGRQLDGEVLLDQTLLDRVGQPGLILDQQYPQCVHTLRCCHAAAPKKSDTTRLKPQLAATRTNSGVLI